MKIISMHQPMATWVILGWKTIETRLHDRFACLKGQRIGIHSTEKFYSVSFNDLFLFGSDEMNLQSTQIFYPHGMILGTVFVEDVLRLDETHSTKSLIDCSAGDRFGLV